MKTSNFLTAIILLAVPVAFTPAFADSGNDISVFGLVSDFDPDQTGAGGGIAASWEWTDTVFLTSQAFVMSADDVDRGRALLGGEWQDRVGGVVGYVGLQAGMDFYDSDVGSEEDGFVRAYYDLGWRVFGDSEIRLGAVYDGKTDLVDRELGLRAAWTTNPVDEGVSFYIRGEVWDEEKNVFAGVSWAY